MLTLDLELDAIFEKRSRPKPFLPTLETLPRFRKGFSQAMKRFLGSPFARKALDSRKQPAWTEEDHAFNVGDGTSTPLPGFPALDYFIYLPSGDDHLTRWRLVHGRS
jgi:hypothetical protein